MKAGYPMSAQRGIFLLEALIGILIFSIGILTLVAMQSAAISAQSDAQYRTEVSKRAEQVASQIWLNVDRTSAATVQTSLATFQHQATGAISSCSYSGAVSAATPVTDWISTLTTGTTAVPGTTASRVQIAVDTSSAAYNKVTVTICWQAPRDLAPRRHTFVTFVN